MTKGEGCAVSATHYRDFLQAALDAGYRVISLAGYYQDRHTPALIVRHDVDVSLSTAMQMAQMEHDLGIRTSYFIRVHAAGYNPFSRENYEALQWLEGQGFDIGLHHEVGVFPLAGPDGKQPTAPEHLCRELAVLRAILGRPITSIAMHLPKHGTVALAQADLDAAGVLYEAGDRLFNEGARFVSDSNRTLKPACPCTLLGNVDKIYLTAHPIWWMNPSVQPEELRETLLQGR